MKLFHLILILSASYLSQTIVLFLEFKKNTALFWNTVTDTKKIGVLNILFFSEAERMKISVTSAHKIITKA